METQSPISTGPKKSTWIWLVLIVVLTLAGGYLVWNYYGKTAAPAATPTPAKVSATPVSDLSAVSSDLSKLDSNLNQLDKIDASEDNAPSL